jgi:predicted amidophosphoribosyltransferase
MTSQCTITCPTCNYKITTFSSRCPRCSTPLLDLFKCSGNCSRCKKEKDKKGDKK